MQDLMKILGGRKFVLSTAGLIVISLKLFGVVHADDSTLWQFLALLLAYLGVEGGADIVSRWKAGELPALPDDPLAGK